MTKTLVAFANSVPLDREPVLFIGVKDDGALTGVLNPENAQKDIQTWATELCYPPISVRCELLDGPWWRWSYRLVGIDLISRDQHTSAKPTSL